MCLAGGEAIPRRLFLSLNIELDLGLGTRPPPALAKRRGVSMPEINPAVVMLHFTSATLQVC
jgi:hypothetical protein